MKRNTLYHSGLVKMGEVEALIESDVTKSKFKGKPPYVFMTIDGEGRTYSTENRDCEDALAGLRGHRVILRAEGRDEDARIEIVEDLGKERGSDRDDRGRNDRRSDRREERSERRTERHEEPRREPPQEREDRQPREDRPPAQERRGEAEMTPEQAMTRAKVFLARRLTLKKIAVRAMLEFRKEYEIATGNKIPEESFWAQVTNLNMSAESEGLGIRKGWADALPVNISIATGEVIEKQKQSPETKPE